MTDPSHTPAVDVDPRATCLWKGLGQLQLQQTRAAAHLEQASTCVEPLGNADPRPAAGCGGVPRGVQALILMGDWCAAA